jgi:outer membrane protein, heavy metal efflux system
MKQQLFVFVLLCATIQAAGAEPRKPASRSFDEFLALVVRANLEVIAARANVSIADAQIEVAKIFPDPQVTAGVGGVDLARTGAPITISVGVSGTFELGGKRGARIDAARSDAAGARSALDGLVRTVRADAANAFIDALAARLVVERKSKTLDSLERLVTANEQRHRSGDIGDIPVIQSRVEREKFRGEVLLASGDARDADLRLLLFVGSAADAVEPNGDLHLAPHAFDPDPLIAQAKTRRSDVVAGRIALGGAKRRITLARANRAIDVTVALGVSHSTEASPDTPYGKIAPTPSVNTLDASLSLPIPWSRVYRGELDAARATASQVETQLAGIELKAEVEVRQALARYDATVAQVRLYTGEILTDSDMVLESTTYNYQRGGATLLEVLEAQRTVDEVYLAYYQALADHAHALVAVERAAGIWDIKL